MKEKLKIYYMCSTHWDREWYLPFQGFRYNLVKMIDDMVGKLEADKEISNFTLDGQTIVLEDYLEIAGERAGKLKNLIKENRVFVGPWYVMPDELLVSGESLIRNLIRGLEIAKKWGTDTWKYGYVNDVFGHIAQMPQIFDGFGIKGAYLGRGADVEKPTSHFLWKSPDGTECITYRGAYFGFRQFVTSKFGTESFSTELKRYIECETEKTDVPAILIMHTGDHIFADENVPVIKKKIKELFPESEIEHVSLEKMVDFVSDFKDRFPVIEGELVGCCKNHINNDNGDQMVVQNSISSYYTLKQRNDKCQILLEKYLEPMLVMAELFGRPLDRTYVNLAYKYLLQNHPHDSICGCSIDKTHNDMHYRFAQIENIGDAIEYDFLSEGDFDNSNRFLLTIHNFEPYEERRTVTVDLKFYGTFPRECDRYAAYEPIDSFDIFNSKGEKIEYQILKTDFTAIKRTKGQNSLPVRKYTVSFVDTLPAMGIKQYEIIPADMRHTPMNKALKSGSDYCENKFIRLNITAFGELEIYDKRTGKKYFALNRFLDDGEMGDGWLNMQPKNNAVVSSVSAPCTIEKLSIGSVAAVFKITKTLSVPAFFDDLKHERSSDRVNLVIESVVTVNVDSPVVEIKTTVDNTAKDHRIRVVMPSGIEEEKYFAGQAFCKVLHKTALDTATLAYYEREMDEKNMNGIIGITDKDGSGLAFVSAEGLHAGRVDEQGDIAVTLLRSFRRVLLQPNAVNSQLQQRLGYKYAVVPMTPDTEYCDLVRIQNRLTDTCAVRFCKDAETKIGEDISYISIDNRRILPSIIKLSESGDSKIVRVFSASEKKEKAVINLGFNAEKAYITNLNEKEISKIEIKDNKIILDVSPSKIVTIKIV